METQELEQKVLSWPARARNLRISDQDTYDGAVIVLRNVMELEQEIIDHHKPIKESAFKAHKVAVAAEKRLLDPLAETKAIIKRSIAAWDQEQERKRIEIQRKLEEDSRRQEEEARLALAVQAEELGAEPETVEEIFSTPAPIITPIITKTYQAARGVSSAQRWKAEVLDIKALCRAIADGRVSPEMVQANMVALNGLARVMKSTFAIPGCRAVPEQSITVRR